MHVCVHTTETKDKREPRGVRDTKKLKSTMRFRELLVTHDKNIVSVSKVMSRGNLITITTSEVKVGRGAMQYMSNGGSVGSDLHVQRERELQTSGQGK